MHFRSLLPAVIVALIIPAATIAQQRTATVAQQRTANVDAIGEGAEQAKLPVVAEIQASKGIASIYTFPTRFSTLIVGDQTIADVAALSDKSIVIEAHRAGTTNLILLDADKKPVREVAIVVNRSRNIVTVHNKGNASSSMQFECGPTGCEYAGETTVQEPVALPRGWSNNTYSNLFPGSNGGQTPNQSGNQTLNQSLTSPAAPAPAAPAGPQTDN